MAWLLWFWGNGRTKSCQDLMAHLDEEDSNSGSGGDIEDNTGRIKKYLSDLAAESMSWFLLSQRK